MNASDKVNKSQGAPGNDTSNTFELVAKPMPKTSMYGDRYNSVFVFGPTGAGERGILIEARALPGGEPMEGIPCSISSLSPDDAVSSGAMTMPIGETRFTDADGIAEFPVTYRRDAGLFRSAGFTIAGGPSSTQYQIDYRRCAGSPDEATYIAVMYPGRPELGEAYAYPHLRVYGIAGSYVRGAEDLPDLEHSVNVRLYQTDGAVMWSFLADAFLSEADYTLSFRMDDTRTGSDETYDIGSMDVRTTGPLGESYHIGGAGIDVKNSHPPLIERSMAPFLYAPVKSARVGEPIYLQWPTYANQQPGEKYRLTEGSGLDVEILPFTFGEVALARLTSSRAWSPNVYLYREVDGVEKFIDTVLLHWE
ncbi:hypothetical protein PCA31118_01024 [Pandoraea captiosa]|uniref:Uncharacterized protein n=1 Tax=Pandoraea captiosa TaxID=2508302 RepID=A0A5E4ZQA3_9BURK|nr:hypothetical protein [Pandoraea captiosa]VVE62475.1 hypothetical protein PCA31118_01024 [Pandoraea captiosa]